MGDVKRKVMKLFQKIQDVKKAGIRSRYGVNQSEVFRLYGMIEWILELEERQGWDATLVASPEIMNDLRTAKERINLTPVTEGLVKKVEMAPGELSYFPKYLELPGSVVREKIVGYLNSDDQLSVANAIPSEVDLFQQPFNFLQFELAFPILYAKQLLEVEDVDNLKQADPYFRFFINRHLDNVIWNNVNPLVEVGWSAGEMLVPLEVLTSENGGLVDFAVISQPNLNDINRVLDQLRICGHRISNLILDLRQMFPRLLEAIGTCLQLTPNLRKLRVVGPLAPELTEDKNCDLATLPSLAHLQTLGVVDGCSRMKHLTRSLLQKYSDQLYHVFMYSRGEIESGFKIPSSRNLTALRLDFTMNTPPNAILDLLSIFSECRLKHLETCSRVVPSSSFVNMNLRKLLTALGTHWKDTLEAISVTLHHDDFTPSSNIPLNVEDDSQSTWMSSLEFSQLRSLQLHGYPLRGNWEFLLLFPNLQELSYYPTEEYLSEEENDAEERNEVEPFIKLHRERDKMLTNNIWKLFPRLERIHFESLPEDDNGEEEDVTLTRKECM